MMEISKEQKQANFFRGLAELADRGTRGEVGGVKGAHVKLFVPDEVRDEFRKWAEGVIE